MDVASLFFYDRYSGLVFFGIYIISLIDPGGVLGGLSLVCVHGNIRAGACDYASCDGLKAAPGTCVYRRPPQHEFRLYSGNPVPLRSIL